MAKGESTYDSSTRTISKFANTPLAVKEYEAKLIPGGELKKAAGAGKLPYINAKFELLNSASKEGGKNRTVMHMFFLNTSPDRDGVAGIDRGSGITSYCRAAGTKLKCPVIPAMKGVKDTDPVELVKVLILDPNAALKFLEGTAGTLLKLKTKNELGQDGKSLWPKVDFFVEAEDGENEDEEVDEDDSDDEDDEDEVDEDDEDSDDEEDSEDEDDEDEDEDEEEDAPAPKSKVKQGPAGKAKKKK